MTEFCGVIVIETSVTALTPNGVEAVVAPETAVIVVVPGDTPVANPEALIVAMLGSEDAQLTLVVMSWAVPSENTPKEVNALVVPATIAESSGLTAKEIRPGGLVRVVG